jgi:hypothetical protein
MPGSLDFVVISYPRATASDDIRCPQFPPGHRFLFSIFINLGKPRLTAPTMIPTNTGDLRRGEIAPAAWLGQKGAGDHTNLSPGRAPSLGQARPESSWNASKVQRLRGLLEVRLLLPPSIPQPRVGTVFAVKGPASEATARSQRAAHSASRTLSPSTASTGRRRAPMACGAL